MKKLDKNAKIFVMIAVLIIGFSIVYYAYDKLSQQYEPETAAGNELSEAAPDFTLLNGDGEEVSLSDYNGQAVVLNFWASWCPPCKSEMPSFDKLSNQYEESGDVVFLMVNLTDGSRETIESAQQYLSDNNLTLNVVFDTTGDAASKYNISSIPSTFLIDRDGNIRGASVGAMTETELTREVTKLLTLE
jgi:cytochrome c biogenesis protein CcmG, thiol:disulfide interchange protein DsbE